MTDAKAWKAADSYCESFGGKLAAIIAPNLQTDLLMLAQLDPSAVGKNSQNKIYQSKLISIVKTDIEVNKKTVSKFFA